MSDERTSTRYRLILMVSLTLGALAMIAAVWWYYLRQRAAVEETAVHELLAITAMQSAQIEHWRAGNIGSGGMIAASWTMPIARKILAGQAVPEADREQMLAVFNAFEREYLYSSVALVDLQGRVLIGSSGSKEDSPRYQTIVQEAQRAGKVTLSDLYREPPPSGRLRMAVSVPVADSGAIVLNINPSKTLYPYLSSWPSASHTGETTLFRINGDYQEYLSELRHAPGSALNFRRRIQVEITPGDRVLAAGWVRRTRDYRGVPVLAVIRRIQGSGWYVSTKVDDEEVYAPLTRLSWELALMVVLIAAANSGGVGLLWRSQRLRAHREHKALAGHFDSLIRYANDIIMLADDQGRIVEANQRAVQSFGYTEEELKTLHTVSLRADVPAQPPIWPDPKLDFGTRYEAVLRRKDGSTFRAEISARMIGVEGTRFCQAIIRDIGDRVRTEKEIKALSARLINAQEAERSRIALELHDDINEQIVALGIGMSNLTSQIPAGQKEAREQCKRIEQNIAQVSESIRRLSHELHPAMLEHAGLAAALRGYCSEFGLLTRIEVACQTNGSFDSVPPDVALCVFRVTQEALQNVAKHARVNQAEVDLTRADGAIRLTVSDQGAGAELNGAVTSAGLGLVSIKERTRLVGGTFEIQSAPQRGTRLTLNIPA